MVEVCPFFFENWPSMDSHNLFFIYGKKRLFMNDSVDLQSTYYTYILIDISRFFAVSMFCTGLMLVRMGGKSL